MKKVTKLLIGVVAIAMSAAGFAAGAEQGASAKQPDLSQSYKAGDLTGMNVQSPDGENLGSISELIVDKDGKVSHVVLNEGGIAGVGGNDYIVPWNRVQLTAGQDAATIDVNKDALSEEFAAFEETTPTAGDRMSSPEQMQDQTQDQTGTSKPSSTNP